MGLAVREVVSAFKSLCNSLVQLFKKNFLDHSGSKKIWVNPIKVHLASSNLTKPKQLSVSVSQSLSQLLWIQTWI